MSNCPLRCRIVSMVVTNRFLHDVSLSANFCARPRQYRVLISPNLIYLYARLGFLQNTRGSSRMLVPEHFARAYQHA